MRLDFNNEKPIYLQIAAGLEDAIFTGAFPEETQIPSTTEISAGYRINPATVLKGMNMLVEEGLIYKKRGLGMFVATGSVERIRKKRQDDFYRNYVRSLILEANKLNIGRDKLVEMLERGYDHVED